jgi:hypothetical protein
MLPWTRSLARLDHVRRALAAARRNLGCGVALQSAALLHRVPLFHPVPDEVCLFAPAERWLGHRGGATWRVSDWRSNCGVRSPRDRAH